MTRMMIGRMPSESFFSSSAGASAFSFQCAVKVMSDAIGEEKSNLSSPRYHPSKSNPSLTGSSGAVAVFPSAMRRSDTFPVPPFRSKDTVWKVSDHPA